MTMHVLMRLIEFGLWRVEALLHLCAPEGATRAAAEPEANAVAVEAVAASWPRDLVVWIEILEADDAQRRWKTIRSQCRSLFVLRDLQAGLVRHGRPLQQGADPLVVKDAEGVDLVRDQQRHRERQDHRKHDGHVLVFGVQEVKVEVLANGVRGQDQRWQVGGDREKLRDQLWRRARICQREAVRDLDVHAGQLDHATLPTRDRFSGDVPRPSIAIAFTSGALPVSAH